MTVPPHVWIHVTAQGGAGCGAFGLDCAEWAITAAIVIFVAMVLVMVGGFSLARRRMRRRLHDYARTRGFVTDPLPPLHMPDAHPPWPDDAPQETTEAGSARRMDPVPDDSKQVRWGDHRLFYDDGRYFFSRESGHDRPWLPVGAVPKNHRVVVGDDGVPRLQREPTPHRRD